MKEVNWTKWSSIAEIISSIAILVTLIFLAVQTSQNTASVQAGIRQDALQVDIQELFESANNPERTLLWCEEELTDLEKSELSSSMVAVIRMREAQFLQYQNRVMDERTWTTNRDGLIAFLSTPRGLYFWEQISQVFFDREFVDDIDGYLRDNPTKIDGCALNDIYFK